MKLKEDPHMVNQLKPRPKDETGFWKERYIKTQYGTGLVTKYNNQSQHFIELTVPMPLKEAVEWALNTNTFRPLLMSHCFKTATTYSIVRPFEGGRMVCFPEEILFEVEIQESYL